MVNYLRWGMAVKVSSENQGSAGYEMQVTNYINSHKRHYTLHLSGGREQGLKSVKNEMGGCWKAQEREAQQNE